MAVVDEEGVIPDPGEELGEWCEIAVGGEDGVGKDDRGLVEGGEDLVGVDWIEVVVGVDGHLGEIGGVFERGVGAGVDDGVGGSDCCEPLEGGEVGGVAVGDEEGVGEACEC